MSRVVKQCVESVEQAEGVGARVRRSIGRSEIGRFDPFLMLDEFKVSPPGGFPDHPHRGFETVTYLLSGAGKHEDFCGHKGILGPGDLQWMTAGRGIVHCEMPHGDKPSHGLQLWVNLKSTDKMVEPRYQELTKNNIPCVEKDGVKVKVIAGSSIGKSSKVYTRTPIIYLDVQMQNNSTFDQPVPSGWNAFTYILDGQADFGPSKNITCGKAHHVLLFSSDENSIHVETKSNACHFVLIGGETINEPIEQYGPFVMNTKEQIEQAINDYRQGKNGFENARTWKSSEVD